MIVCNARIIVYDAPGGTLYFKGWIAPVMFGWSQPDFTPYCNSAMLADNHHDSFASNRDKTYVTMERIRRRMGWCRAHNKLRLETVAVPL